MKNQNNDLVIRVNIITTNIVCKNWFQGTICVRGYMWSNEFLTDSIFAVIWYMYYFIVSIELGAAVAEWLSSWLAEQEDRGSIPGLATWIFRDWLSPASKSRYGWKIAKSTLILKTTNQLSIELKMAFRHLDYGIVDLTVISYIG